MIATVNKLNKIVKVSMDEKITVLESNQVLDFPASVKIDNSSKTTSGQQRQRQGKHHLTLYITNFDFLSSSKHLVTKVALLKAGLGSSSQMINDLRWADNFFTFISLYANTKN